MKQPFTGDITIEMDEYDVVPTITLEDEPIHDGVNPCGDPECPCATYGYDEPESEAAA